MTYPGLGGQQPAPYNAPAGQAPQPGVTPGVPPLLRVTEIIITPGGQLEGIFTYSSKPPAAGTLIESASVAVAGTDAYGNDYVAGHATYGSGFAAALDAGFVQFYTGSLAGGWNAGAEILTDSGNDLILFTAGGTLTLDAAGDVTITGNLIVSTINGSADTGTGLPAGSPTAGPNGATFAGHTHDFDGHTHAI